MRFSVVIPTYQRRDLALRLVAGLEQQGFRDFEAIVVVDGSTDGTASALRALRVSFPLTVREQANRGAGAARNAGAAAATGELLLFLDDDMEPDPDLLAEHDRSHREGADLVLGHLPLHPASPPTPIAAATGRWAERRRDRLADPGARVPVADLLTGQMSISREAFERLGGFDLSFTRRGLVPGADRDFGYRARRAGMRIAFNPAAVSYQYYEVTATEYTRRARDGARGDYILRMKYPEVADELWDPVFHTRAAKLLLGLLAHAPTLLSSPVRLVANWLFSRPRAGRASNRFFFAVQTMERIRGIQDARRALRSRAAVVLAYHAIADLTGTRLARYGVPPDRFAAHLRALANSRWSFVGVNQLLDSLEGTQALPKHALLITFDDGYADLLDAAGPILAELAVPAVVFAVSDRVGAESDWSRRGQAAALPLLDADGLRALAAQGMTVGSHGATHRSLVGLGPDELRSELTGSAQRLHSLGIDRPSAFSYPYGECTPEVATQVRAAGYAAAFTVAPGVVRWTSDRYALPRIEVYAGDTSLRLMVKLAVAGWPDRWRRAVLWALDRVPNG